MYLKGFGANFACLRSRYCELLQIICIAVLKLFLPYFSIFWMLLMQNDAIYMVGCHLNKILAIYLLLDVLLASRHPAVVCCVVNSLLLFCVGFPATPFGSLAVG